MNRKGFAAIIVILIVVAVLIVGGVIYYKMHRLSSVSPVATNTNLPSTNSSPIGTMTTYAGIGAVPTAVAFDGKNMWGTIITSTEYDPAGGNTVDTSGSIIKISPTGATTTYAMPSGIIPVAIAFDGTNMWVDNDHFLWLGADFGARYGGNSVTEISPTGAMTSYVIKGTGVAGPGSIAFDGKNMWVVNEGSNTITEISPTGTMTSYPDKGSSPFAIAFDGTNMWVLNLGTWDINTGNFVDSYATKITPTGIMTNYPDDGSARDIVFDGINMWTLNPNDNSLTEVTPSGQTTTYQLPTGTEPYGGMAFDGANMWIANYASSSVTKVTPSGATTMYFGIGTYPDAIAFDGINMWVTNSNNSSVTKIVAVTSTPATFKTPLFLVP